MARLQDLENKEVAEHWFNKGMQIGAEPLPHPSKDTPPRPNPNTPPSSPWLPGKSPAVPGQGLELAHDYWDGESLSDKWGAVWNEKDNRWMLPPDSPNGNLRFASDEESQMLEEDALHREQFNRDTPHPHQEGWDQAGIYMGEQFPNKFDQILNPRGDFSRPSLDQLREGVKEKKRTGGLSLAMGDRTGSTGLTGRSLMPDGNYGFPKEGMKVNTGGLKGEDYIFKGNKWVKDA